MLFDCLDIDDKRDDALKRSLSYKEVAFLDTWGTAEVAPVVVDNAILKTSSSNLSVPGAPKGAVVALPEVKSPLPSSRVAVVAPSDAAEASVSNAEVAGSGSLEVPRSPRKADALSFYALPQRTAAYTAFLAPGGLAAMRSDSLHKWNHLVAA